MRRIELLLLVASVSLASEHHGIVRFRNQPVPGVTVSAVQGSNRVSTVTDSSGRYSLPDLADGTWTFRIEMLCFTPVERLVTVGPNEPLVVWDLEMLPIGSIRTAAGSGTAASVMPSVECSPRSVTDVATEPQPSSTGSDKPVSGVRAESKASSDAPPANSSAGLPPEAASDSFLVNGSVNNGAASPFSQSAAFGNMRKRGKSPYQFALSATLGNAIFDARPYSLTGLRSPKAGYNQAQGAISMGGPLAIPHILPRRDISYFFLSYQWVRNRNADNQAGLVPTEAERAGDLSQTVDSSGDPVRFADPSSGAAASSNVIPASRVSPQAKVLLSRYPLPNGQSGSYNYETVLRSTNNSDTFQADVYEGFSRGNLVTGRVRWQRNSADTPNLFGFTDTTHGAGLNAVAIWGRRVSSRLSTNLRLEYSRFSSRVTPYFAYRENVSGNAGVMGNNQDPENWGPPALSFSGGIAGLEDGQYSLIRNQTTGLCGSLSWSRGTHTVQAGADIRRQQFNTNGQENPRGTFGFTGAATAITSDGVTISGTGSDLAGFLFGIPDTSKIAYGNADKYLRAGMYDAYVNDDWHMRPGLSVNAGLRWEYGSPITELYGRLVNLDITSGFGAASAVVASSPTGTLTGTQYPKSLMRPDKFGIQPRIGIAWRPIPASSLLVRAGYGVYYDSSVYQAIAIRMTQQPPLSTSFSIQNSTENPLTLANGFNKPSSSTSNTFAVDPDFQVGYAQTWQAKVQRDLPAALVLSAGYLGTKGTRAQQQFLPNTYPTGMTNPCPACPSGFIYLTSTGNSIRHAAQIQLRRRMHRGFQAALEYTFAKAIDNASLGGRGEGTAVIAQDWLNLRGERGLSTFDQRHLLTVQTQFITGLETLGGMLLRGWRSAALRGWTISSNLTLGSGLPLTPVYSSVVQGTGVVGSIRPNYTGALLYDAPAGLHLNPLALTAPAGGEWGNAGRNSITGPSQFAFSASIGRSFYDERFEVRADADNVLNHVVYKKWNTSITSTQFGLPTAADSMRNLRLTMRVRF
ncbi:MAG: carboxypeptidase regulatory-like domain-containing protein [Bryobacteraceae bacterium]